MMNKLLNPFRMYKWWAVTSWIIWSGAFAILEYLGIKRFHGMIPLTWVVRDTVPKSVLGALLGWLLVHFLIATNANQPEK